MYDEYVQLADGSYRSKSHTRVCELCKERYLRDEAKDRGDNRVLCDNCAKKENINFCKICGCRVDFQYNETEIQRCIRCRNKEFKENVKTQKEKSILRDIINTAQDEDEKEIHYLLIALGDAQKAGDIPYFRRKNKTWIKRRKKWIKKKKYQFSRK